MGHFKKDLSGDEKQEILEILDKFRYQHTSLIVPITLLSHFIRKYDDRYLQHQYCLNSHPLELKRWNHW